MGMDRRKLLMTLPVLAGGTVVLSSCGLFEKDKGVVVNLGSDNGGDEGDVSDSSDSGGEIPSDDPQEIPTNAPAVKSQDIDGVSYTMMPEFLTIGGGPTTENRIRIYSDMACPHCKALDEQIHEKMEELIVDEQLIAEFVIVNYLGEGTENSWSLQCANLLAVVAVSQPDKFLKVKETLYANQPEDEGGEYLAELLRDLVSDVIEFSDDDVKKIDEGFYVDWVNITVNNFAANNLVSSVPTVVWNETVLDQYGEIVETLEKL